MLRTGSILKGNLCPIPFCNVFALYPMNYMGNSSTGTTSKNVTCTAHKDKRVGINEPMYCQLHQVAVKRDCRRLERIFAPLTSHWWQTFSEFLFLFFPKKIYTMHYSNSRLKVVDILFHHRHSSFC